MQTLEPQLRCLTPDDVPSVMAVMKKIGWNHPEAQTRQYIAWGGEGSFCLAFDEQVVATAIALKYSERLAWVGLVISDPSYQRRGFARRLMNHVMAYLTDIQSVMLDASTLGFPLYDNMGFQSLYKVNACSGVAQRFAPHPTITQMTTAHLQEVIALDTDLNGQARTQVIEWLFNTGSGFVSIETGHVTGYAFAKVHEDTLRVGSWYANSEANAAALLQTCSTLAAEGGYMLRTSSPDVNGAAQRILQAQGITLERSVTRMVYGAMPPGHMSDQYGIVSFMTG